MRFARGRRTVLKEGPGETETECRVATLAWEGFLSTDGGSPWRLGEAHSQMGRAARRSSLAQAPRPEELEEVDDAHGAIAIEIAEAEVRAGAPEGQQDEKVVDTDLPVVIQVGRTEDNGRR